ncbi:MAG: UDP-N-acetylmuramoyl-L-alanine--D-glutamate ligase [Phycisphaeraceae bacterium]|nr:UDP-N-acetylmuramoyl-L-alanine--D-glutamate ligase [Phycisphaeraceae bacterium]
MHQLCDKRVVVMGLGRFGGGVGVTRYLVGEGADVLVTDTASEEQLRQSINELDDLSIDIRLGSHVTKDFTDADLVVINPAVDPQQNPYLQAAGDAGVAMTSEIRLLVDRLPERLRTIGVTGSAGKSTVTAMIGHILALPQQYEPAPRVHVGGNLGGSLLTDLDQIDACDWVVLELSSFMLQGLSEDQWSPHIAVITNIWPNHLDRHGTFEDYVQAKQAIVKYQSEDDCAVLRQQDINHFSSQLGHRLESEGVVLLGEPCDSSAGGPFASLCGHQRINAMIASNAASRAGVRDDQIQQGISTFIGLPHRLHRVGIFGGIEFYNDSKATTPQSAIAAMESFSKQCLHVILGGYDKGVELKHLASCASSHCQSVYTVGATGPAIARLCEQQDGGAKVFCCGTLDRAVDQAIANANSGDIVLLSPGCASWDQFENYENRGSAFITAVRRSCCGDP